MILSERLGLVFIKGRKVAGTSVEMALATSCGPDDVVTPIMPVDELERLREGGAARNWTGDAEVEAKYLATLTRASREDLMQLRPPRGAFRNHMSLSAVINAVGDVTGHLEVVCVERDPYAKLLSWASWQPNLGAYRAGSPAQADHEALPTRAARVVESGEMAQVRNVDLYRHPNGSLPARVLRYEHLEQDLRSLMADRGLEPLPLPHAKRGAMASTLDPREFFSKAHIAEINDFFAEEFEVFGYTRL